MYDSYITQDSSRTRVTPGGWSSILYTFRQARAAGGILRMWRALSSRNACKTCAVGMGGQAGGMVNEEGEFPEFCKKSVQAMAADLQAPIPSTFWQQNPVARMASMSPRQLEASGRLAEPLFREDGADHYRPITWDEALERAARVLAATPPERSFFYFSGRSSSEAAFLLQLGARLYGTNNINNCSYYCHQASGVGLQSVTGSGTATVVLEDLSRVDTIVLIGANPASNHPRLMKSLLGVRRRGGQVIVVNPIREAGLERFSVPSDPRSLLFGSRIATHVVQPHIGGDADLLCGVARSLIERDLVDTRFIASFTHGYDAFQAGVMARSWGDLEEGSGCARAEIDRLADLIADGERVIFAWAMGVTHHRHGTATVQLIAAVAMLRGMLGKPGCGLMPIRGHSNVQGIGSIGVTPTLKKAIFDGLTTRHDLKLPQTPGLDTMACMQAAEAGSMDVGFHLGGNLFGSNPDADWAARALSGLPWQVTLSTTLNTGHARAASPNHLILPVLARDEEPQPTTQESMFNFVRLSSGGPARFPGPRSEIDIIADLFGRVGALRTTGIDPLHALDWPNMTETAGVRRMMADVVPGWEALSELDNGGEEFHISGRTFHTPAFATPDGKARFQQPDFTRPVGRPDQLRLMTIRSEGQFNTVVYEEEDLYRGPRQRDVVLLHPLDIAERGLTDGQRVRVEGPGGRMPHQRVFAFDRIRPGNAAMYFPEANQLLDRRVDADSRTPAFKGSWITLLP